MTQRQTTTVLPGVNFTRAGIIMVSLDVWALLRVHLVLLLTTTDGEEVMVVHKSLTPDQLDRIHPLEVGA